MKGISGKWGTIPQVVYDSDVRYTPNDTTFNNCEIYWYLYINNQKYDLTVGISLFYSNWISQEFSPGIQSAYNYQATIDPSAMHQKW